MNGNGRSLSDGNAASGANYGTIGLLILVAASRGNVTISSNSMFDKPVISVNWLLDERDQEIAVQAYRRGRDIWSKFDSSVKTGPEAAPGANMTSYDDILKYITTKGVGAIHHATSTCKC